MVTTIQYLPLQMHEREDYFMGQAFIATILRHSLKMRK